MLFAAAVVFHSSTAGFAQADHPSHAEKLGSVSFSTSCSAAVQSPFNRAVALMHSFQFASAIDAFRGVLSTDPSCSMAYWGIALSNCGNPFASGVKAQAQLDRGMEAVTAARAAKPKTARERAYVEAVARLFTDTAHTDQQTRVRAYESAMASVSAAFPDDIEASIFYALAIAATHEPADKKHARQINAEGIVRAIFPHTAYR
jgi:hypothetical protein